MANPRHCPVCGRIFATRHKAQRTCSWACGATKHGQSLTPTYKAWIGMRDRCTNPDHHDWLNYGGRGISVCDRWMNSFEAFLADMGDCSKGLSIDRINNDGNYEPSNCRWATADEQNRNRRNNRFLTIDGESLVLPDWGRRAGFSPQMIRSRLKRGWSPERAVTEPRIVGRSR